MKRINFFSVKQVRESGGNYDLATKFVRKPDDAIRIIRTVVSPQDEAQEVFGILTLTTKNEVAGVHMLSKGSLNAAVVHPREVFKAAILNNAASIICFHNHPSGDPAPSTEDITLTNRIQEAGTILGIDVLDHVIIGYERNYSMKEQGDI